MNLIIDIGNTRAKVARMEQGRVVDISAMSHDFIGIEEVARNCKAAIVSNVAAVSDASLHDMLGHIAIPCIELLPTTPLPIPIHYGSRATLGADRVAAAIGAWRVCPDCPCLVIDSGTCITIDLILPGNGFVGGNISAGIDMRLRACHEFTGRLPLAKPQTNREILGTDTLEALQNGAMMGVKYELEGYVRAFAAKYSNLALFMTGGAAFRFDVPQKVTTFVRPYLVVEGLDAILEYNKSKRCN